MNVEFNQRRFKVNSDNSAVTMLQPDANTLEFKFNYTVMEVEKGKE